MEKILTIIIPTYNMEEYLSRCLGSLVIDSDRMRLMQVLVINDGSKDKSSAIAHEYQEKYPETFNVIDKVNGNYGSCVNRGLKEATGKYIKVLDADDYFDTKCLTDYVEKLSCIDTDLVITDFTELYRNTNKINTFKIPSGKVLNISQYILNPDILELRMHAITYRLSILKDICYHQTEGISYTDQEWASLPFAKVNTFFYYKRPLYQYLLYREGQTMAPAVFAKKIEDQFQGIENSIVFADSLVKQTDELHMRLVQRKIAGRIASIYRFYLVENTKQSLSRLIAFDKTLQTNHLLYYNITEEAILQKYFPYKYIRKWRQKSYHPLSSCTIRLNKVIKDLITTMKRLIKYN